MKTDPARGTAANDNAAQETGGLLSRLRELFEEMFQGNLAQFSVTTGIAEKELQLYLDGEIPGVETLETLSRNAGVSCKWLLLGEGEMKEAGNIVEEHTRAFLRTLDKIAGAIDMLANSSNNVAQANKILAESNSVLISKLTFVLSKIEDNLSLHNVPYPTMDDQGKRPASASDVSGEYKP